MGTPGGTPTIKGPGVLFVNSRISRPDILSSQTFLRWYDEDHIAEITQDTGGAMPSAFRYINANPHSPKPFLSFYPMPDLGFTQGDRFRRIRVQSQLLPSPVGDPNGGIVYDLAEFNVRYYGFVEKTMGKRRAPARKIVTVGIEPSDPSQGRDVEHWIAGELMPTVGKIAHYTRTTRYKLQYARSNAQSRQLKGLGTSEEQPPEPPTYMAIVEFDNENIDISNIHEVVKTLKSPAKEVEIETWNLAKAHGDWSFFD